MAVESVLGEINCTLDKNMVYPLKIVSFDRISDLEGHILQSWHGYLSFYRELIVRVRKEGDIFNDFFLS